MTEFKTKLGAEIFKAKYSSPQLTWEERDKMIKISKGETIMYFIGNPPPRAGQSLSVVTPIEPSRQA